MLTKIKEEREKRRNRNSDKLNKCFPKETKIAKIAE